MSSKDENPEYRRTPYEGQVPLCGATAPRPEDIDGLIKLLETIRHRFGNTCVNYKIKWGSSSLWEQDALTRKVKYLQKRVKNLKAKLPIKRK